MSVHLSNESGSSRVSVLFFILATLGMWWLFAVLAHSVVRCVPGGAPCWYPWQGNPSPPDLSETVSIAVLIVSLLAAVWAAQRMVFPPEDFSTPQPHKSSVNEKSPEELTSTGARA